MKRGDTEKAMYRVAELARALHVHPETMLRWLRRDNVQLIGGGRGSPYLVPSHEVRSHYPVAWYALQMSFELKRNR